MSKYSSQALQTMANTVLQHKKGTPSMRAKYTTLVAVLATQTNTTFANTGSRIELMAMGISL